MMLFRGAVQAQRNETDHEPIMRQESFFAHLFGVMESGCYAVIDGATGRSTLFIPRLPAEYVIWMGAIAPPESFTQKYGVKKMAEQKLGDFVICLIHYHHFYVLYL